MTLTCLCDCHCKINPCKSCIEVNCIMNDGHITWNRQRNTLD